MQQDTQTTPTRMTGKSERQKLRQELEEAATRLETRIDELRGRAQRTLEEDKRELEGLKQRARQTWEEDIEAMTSKLDKLRVALHDGVERASEATARQLRKLIE